MWGFEVLRFWVYVEFAFCNEARILDGTNRQVLQIVRLMGLVTGEI